MYLSLLDVERWKATSHGWLMLKSEMLRLLLSYSGDFHTFLYTSQRWMQRLAVVMHRLPSYPLSAAAEGVRLVPAFFHTLH